MSVVIKAFKTPKGKYVYDRETSSVLSVSDTEFIALKRVENNEASETDWKTLQRYIDQGYLPKNHIERVAFPDTFRYELNSRIQQLTLQVTQNCNLRCSYCAYSGGYEHQRTHSNKTMPLSIMKKSIDFAMARSKESGFLYIGFYGGEPLLEIRQIQTCVDYVKEVYGGRAVMYNITTNGTLFNDKIIKFLMENNINVTISIDGPRELHNANRVYADGRGSFDDIMKNMAHIKECYPQFFRTIQFITTVAPGVDLSCINNFFDAETILAESSIRQNRVSELSSKEAITYDDQYYLTDNYQQVKTLLAALGLYPEEKTSRLFIRNISHVERLHEGLSKQIPSGTLHPGGPCIPGAARLFITADGTFYPCERVNEDSEIMKIGHIDHGFDLEKIEQLLNVGKLTEEECKACWNFVNCTLCCVAADGGTKLPIADWQKEQKERAAKRYTLCDEYYSLKDEIPNMEAIRRSIEGLIRDEPQRGQPIRGYDAEI